MILNAVWFAIVWLGLPLALVAGIVAVVQDARKRYGQPELDGHLLFQAESVYAQSGLMIGAPPYRIWITDREVVLRLRPGYRPTPYGDVEVRIPADHVAAVLELPNGKLRLGLTGGGGRHWDFREPPAPLVAALRKLAPPLPRRP